MKAYVSVLGLAELGVEAAAIGLKPLVCLLDIAFIDAAKQRMERGAVIKMNKVRDFMRCDRAAHMIGCLYEPPVQSDALRAARSAV